MQESGQPLAYTAAEPILERKDKGSKLNLPDVTAFVASSPFEGPREGRRRSVIGLVEARRSVLTLGEVMIGVPETFGRMCRSRRAAFDAAKGAASDGASMLGATGRA